jgi:hypothetical protein
MSTIRDTAVHAPAATLDRRSVRRWVVPDAIGPSPYTQRIPTTLFDTTVECYTSGQVSTLMRKQTERAGKR